MNIDIGPIPLPGPDIGLPNWLNPAAGIGPGQVVGSIAGGFLDAISHALASAVDLLGKGLLSLITDQTSINLAGGWWTGARAGAVMAVVVEMAKVVMLICVLIAIISAVLRGSPGAAAKAATVEVVLSVFGIVMVATFVQGLAAAVDWASNRILAQVPGNLGHFLTTGAGTATVGGATALSGGLLGVVFMALLLAAMVILFLELLMRSAAVYLLVALTPLALGARVWERLAEVWRKLVTAIVVLVVAKLVVAVALALGAAAVAGTPSASVSDALKGFMVGLAILLVAAYAPFMLFRLVPLMELAAWGGEARRQGAAQVSRGIGSAERVMGEVAGAAVGDPTGGPAASSGGAAGAAATENSGADAGGSDVVAGVQSASSTLGGLTPVGLPPGPSTDLTASKTGEGHDKKEKPE